MLKIKEIVEGMDVAFFLAIKNLFFKKKMLIMIVVIIGLGFLSTTFSSSVIYGLQYTIEDKVISSMTGNVLIEPKSDEVYLTNSDEIIKKALAIPGVVAASPHINRGITFIDKYGTTVSTQLKVIDPDKEARTTVIDNNVIAGKPPNSFDFQKILKNPLVYLGATFLIFLIILWFWSPGFMKDDEEKTKLWLLLVITTSLSLASTGAIWWFFLKKKSD